MSPCGVGWGGEGAEILRAGKNLVCVGHLEWCVKCSVPECQGIAFLCSLTQSEPSCGVTLS